MIISPPLMVSLMITKRVEHLVNLVFVQKEPGKEEDVHLPRLANCKYKYKLKLMTTLIIFKFESTYFYPLQV